MEDHDALRGTTISEDGNSLASSNPRDDSRWECPHNLSH